MKTKIPAGVIYPAEILRFSERIFHFDSEFLSPNRNPKNVKNEYCNTVNDFSKISFAKSYLRAFNITAAIHKKANSAEDPIIKFLAIF